MISPIKITMEMLSRKDSEKIKILIHRGSVFVYPTDTIYGLGCDATNQKSVLRVRNIKKRKGNPFSVIAPSKKWILENCEARPKDLERLPGPYTLILRLKRKCVAPGVNLQMGTLGVRIPDHWFSRIVSGLGTPVVTTSANVSGQKFMTSIDNLDSAIKESVDFIVYEGPKCGSPSKIINLTTGKTSR